MASWPWEIPGCSAIVTHGYQCEVRLYQLKYHPLYNCLPCYWQLKTQGPPGPLLLWPACYKFRSSFGNPQFQCFTRTTCRIQDSSLLGLPFSYKRCGSRPAKGENVRGLWWGLPDRKLPCFQDPSLPSTWKQDPTSGEYFLLESQHVDLIAWMAQRLSQSPSASIPRGWVASEIGGNGAGHNL